MLIAIMVTFCNINFIFMNIYLLFNLENHNRRNSLNVIHFKPFHYLVQFMIIKKNQWE
jgi:hypothetical protein